MKPAPSYKNPPERLNPEAMDLWRRTVRRYADDIYASKNLREQWEKAKSHFERQCRLKGVSPYTNGFHRAAARLERLIRRF